MNNGVWNARLPLILGFAAIILLVGVVGAWSVGTRIAGAVVATGVIKVESERQVVQHPDGGVVGTILARDGDRVEAGATLVRLDDTFLLSELSIVERQLLEIQVRKARLAAERDGEDAVSLGELPEFILLDQAWIDDQIKGQVALFDARRVSLSQEVQQLDEQRVQIDQQIDGMEAQLTAFSKQLEIIASERADLEGLLEKGLVQQGRVLELLREEAGLQGEIGRLTASIAEARTRQSSLAIESLKLTDSRREEAITRLRDIQYSEIELLERKQSLTERLNRMEVRAPVSGTVFGSTVFAVGGVIRPADPMMYIVPGDQPLEVSARIDPIDIDQVYPGQPVALVFSTFSRRTTPEVQATVHRVSADAVEDQSSGLSYYEAIVAPDPESLLGLGDLQLLPGMPVEVYLKTEERTPLAYLTQPLTVYFNRAFREE